MKYSRTSHPLAQRHFKKVCNRNPQLRAALHSVWVVTWNLRGRSMVRLGTASMMAMSYHPRFAGTENAIELLCLTAKTDVATGSIHYSNVRMAHDFSRNPYPGARDRILDPRDEGEPVRRGERPNGSWVRLAMEADRLACRAVDQNWLLPVVPTLPTFYAGFSSMAAIEMAITPAMLRDIAHHMEKPIAYVESLSQAELTALAAAHWPSLWRAPQTAGNDTGMWLINTAYLASLDQTPHLFEDFSGMLGMEVWNPIRDIQEFQFENPTRDCAREQGIDLEALLAVVVAGGHTAAVAVTEQEDAPRNAYVEAEEPGPMTPTSFACEYDEAVDRLLFLRTCVRSTLGRYGKQFNDEDLNAAVFNPDTPLRVATTDPSADLSPEDALRLCRQNLDATRPLVSEGTTDEDLAKAIASPGAPLFASKMCNVQVLRRDTRISPEVAFSFTPASLARDRVYAHLWAGEGWSPRAGQGGKHVPVGAASAQPV